MRKTFTKIAISAALAFGLAGVTVTLAEAGVPARNPVATPASAGSASIVDVQYRHHRRHSHRRHHRHRHYRGRSGIYFGFGTPYYRPNYVRPPVYVRPHYVSPGYRVYSGSHVRWCYDRYRSYRASDNTYQPYHGPRRQCYSPYR